MSKIEKFISEVEAEARVTILTGVLPDVNKDIAPLERLSKKFPDMDIDVNREKKIMTHTRMLFNARNN